MWIVAKIKSKELEVFKDNLIKKFGKETKFYYPKIECHRYLKNKLKKSEKLILGNYIFCYHELFCKSRTINGVRFLKGLEYLLNGHHQSQNEIIKFIKHCKAFESAEGYLSPAFFKTLMAKKAQFISGPFTNMIFEILEVQKNKLKILVGNIVTTISDKKNYLYRPI